MRAWAQLPQDLSTLFGLVGRFVLSVPLTVTIGGAAVIVAWGLYVFSGSTSWNVWFWTRVCAAGAGAGLGSYLAWMVSTVPKPNKALAAIAVAIVLAGILGGWLGYHWGETQEVACCAKPRTSSMAYTIFGAMMGANLSSMVLGVYSQLKWKLPRPPKYARTLSSSGSP